MAKALQIPYGEEITPIEVEDKLSPERLDEHLEDSGGESSFCVRRTGGHPNRGGYFFHVQKTSDGGYRFKNFDELNSTSPTRCTLQDLSEAARFINHVSGLEYSEQMWEVSKQVNLREDEHTS